MDKQLLVKALQPYFLDLKQHDAEVIDFRIGPAFPGFAFKSYWLGVVIPSLNDVFYSDRNRFLIERKRTVLPEDARKALDMIMHYKSAEEMNEDMDEREGIIPHVSSVGW